MKHALGPLKNFLKIHLNKDSIAEKLKSPKNIVILVLFLLIFVGVPVDLIYSHFTSRKSSGQVQLNESGLLIHPLNNL